MARRQAGRPAQGPIRASARGREGLREGHRRARGALAAAAARRATRATWRSFRGDLAAGLFDLTVAARSIVDDNYGWDVWETAGKYPPQKAESDLETVNLSGEEVWLNTRKIRLRRRLPKPKQRLRPAGLKPQEEGEVPRRVGAADRRQRHLLLSARGHRGRRLRALPAEEGQEHPLGRARAHGAVHHLGARRNRPARDHSQLAREQDLRARSSTRSRAKWVRWW